MKLSKINVSYCASCFGVFFKLVENVFRFDFCVDAVSIIDVWHF